MAETHPPQIAARMLYATLVVYLVLAVLYNGFIRLDQSADEPWHYAYIESLAMGKGLPSPKETHQAQHPPFYYAIAAVMRAAVGPFLNVEATKHAVRFVATLLGLCTLLLVYRLARLLAPGDPWLAIATPAMVAFLPMFTYITSVVNNDGAVVLCLTAFLLFLATFLRDGAERSLLAAGVALGLALLSKETALAAWALLPAAVLWRFRAVGDPTRVGRKLAIALGVPLILWIGWPLHNRLAWGTFFLHTTAKPEQQEILANLLAHPALFLQLIVQTIQATLTSFLAPQWILKHFVEMPTYRGVVIAGIALVVAGLVLGWRQAKEAPSWKIAFLWFCLAAEVLLVVGIFHYVLAVDYTAIVAGRYLLPLVAVMALFASLALRAWVRLVTRSARALTAVAILLWVLLLAGNVWFLQVTRTFYTGYYWLMPG